MTPISHVMIYSGHQKHPLFGSYHENIVKQMKMFEILNQQRENPWKITQIDGDELVEALQLQNPHATLLVVPAGQSSKLEQVFTVAQTTFLKENFFSNGGRGYFTCGAAYWITARRIYKEVCEERPEMKETLAKTSTLPLFEGTAEGPLCPFPGEKYKVGFYSDAVNVCSGVDRCTIFLSGGGSFILDSEKCQKVRVLVRYPHSELIRLGKKQEECTKWENSTLLVSIGKGAVVLSMFHPYYGAQDINAEVYERAFPDCGTDWKRVQGKLSPLDERLEFFKKHMLEPLEKGEFN